MQNSKQEDFIHITQQFIQRLIQRRHKQQDIIPVLQTEASTIDSVQGYLNPTNSQTNKDDTLYIHWKLHPRDIKKNVIRQIYNKSLKDNDGFLQMIIVISGPSYLRDILCRTQIPIVGGRNVSGILQKIRNPT
jgi:hypothetical protein